MTNIWGLVKGGIAIGGTIILSGNSAIAKVNLDATLPNNFGITAQEKTKIIQGGNCKNTADIQNIINKVTDKKYSLLRNRIIKIDFQHSIKPTQIPSIDPSKIPDINTDEKKQVTDYLPLIIPVKPIQLSGCTCWSNDVHDFVNCPCPK
ncbi:MAG: hypothetical protein V7K53_02305 [Nostoc sp.]|uniref:hypothetical protein n=1 Tax=unclassified Nostoc TaxID=2593658 RepID=UPI002AD593B6|nr:hypothetical protein [Nostoc sp. DedQUE04]MDZ8134079.1 hypothetical protein [Nostoc sp. DedQUE04]